MSELGDGPTEEMIRKAGVSLALDLGHTFASIPMEGDWQPGPNTMRLARKALTAALSVSPLREQRDRYERALENIAGTECIRVPDGCPPDDLCWSCEANAALSPSYKGEQ